jgi:hypothetical protein
MSFSRIPLSTTALCWKKTIHGAIVVPMLAISMKKSSLVNPPGGSCGTMLPWSTSWRGGFTRKAPGMCMRLTPQNTSAIFSHVQYRPWSTIAAMSTVTTMTVIQGATPKILRAAVMPMNSVTSVSQSTRIRSSRENRPQKGPNA